MENHENNGLLPQIEEKALEKPNKTADKISKIVKDLSEMSSTSLSTNSNFPTPIQPKGKIFNLVPKLVHCKERSNLMKQKEPKFVPFEPYKAAVNPIMPFKNGENKIKVAKDRNNLDLNILVSQMSSITNEEIMNRTRNQSETSTCSEYDGDKYKYEKQISELKRECSYYENQLKFQAQVNSELKNLLIASVGEDLQTKVNLLTEDKLFLARALVNTSENLTSHSEEIEFLSGQSEVWRSKFLASSLMVEELARWKASLTQKNNMCSSLLRQFLELTSKLREMQLEIIQNLSFLANVKELDIQSANVLDLTSESLNITQQLVLQHSSLGMPSQNRFSNLETQTDVEKDAVEQLQNPSQNLLATDEALRAVVGQAFPVILSMKQNNEKPLEKDFVIVDKPDEPHDENK